MRQLQGIFRYIARNKFPYLALIPFFVVYIVFWLYPLIFSVILSFSRYSFKGPIEWVGIQNYIQVLHDETFKLALKNTLLLWVGTLPVQIVVGFVFASLLNTLSPRWRGGIAGIYYLPVVSNLVAVALIFELIFDFRFGILNYLLSLLSIKPLPWLSSSILGKIAVIILIAWRGTGWYIVLTLAALQSIDRTYYEAAKIDGANFIAQALYITLPLMRPIILFFVVMGTISGWQIFTEPFLLFNSGPGPLQTGLTANMYIYFEGFKYLKFSNASAMAFVLGAITICFSILQFRFGGRE